MKKFFAVALVIALLALVIVPTAFATNQAACTTFVRNSLPFESNDVANNSPTWQAIVAAMNANPDCLGLTAQQLGQVLGAAWLQRYGNNSLIGALIGSANQTGIIAGVTLDVAVFNAIVSSSEEPAVSTGGGGGGASGVGGAELPQTISSQIFGAYLKATTLRWFY